MIRTCLLMIWMVLPLSVVVNDLPPLASFTNDVNRNFFFAGETVTFDGSESMDQDEGGGHISRYKWRVDGLEVHVGNGSEYRIFTTSFSLSAGQNSKTVQVQLEVRDDEGTWTTHEGKMTRTYTIRRGQDRKFYVKDYLGSVRVTVDEEGEPIGYDDYYPYGLGMPTRSSNTSNPNDAYKYTGHERDTEAGLTFDYMGARTYDPLLGIFQQIDPLLEFASPYSYVGGNPVNSTDPTGMSSCSENGEVGLYSAESNDPCDNAVSSKSESIERKEGNSEEENQPEPVSFKKINIHDSSEQEVIDQVFKYLYYMLANNKTKGNLNEAFDFKKSMFLADDYEAGPIGGGFLGSKFEGVLNIKGINYNISMFLGFSDSKIDDPYNTGINFENNIKKQSLSGTPRDAVNGTTTTNFQLFIGAPYSRNEYKPILIVTQSELLRDQLLNAFKPKK